MSLTRRTRRSVLLMAISSICCDFSGRVVRAPPASRPRAPRSEVSGVRSSWETVEMNSSFMRSRARRSVVSVKATTTPTALPFAVAMVGVGFDLGAGDVLDGEAGAVFAPEDLVGDADGVEMGEAVADGGVFGGIGRAVGAGVVDELVHVAAEHLVLLVAEHLRGGGIDDGDVAVEVDAEDAVADGLEDGVGLAGEGAEPAFGADLLADVDAEAEDVGLAVRERR